jgi:hypothetical protein
VLIFVAGDEHPIAAESENSLSRASLIKMPLPVAPRGIRGGPGESEDRYALALCAVLNKLTGMLRANLTFDKDLFILETLH